MNILLLASHEIAEYDDVRMFSDAGYDVFAPGAYEDPLRGGILRPSLPLAPDHPELRAACQRVRDQHGDPGEMFDWAKAAVPDQVLDWADVVIVHHWPERWLMPQWRRFRQFGVRVVWRTCGQSDPRLEAAMTGMRTLGLQIVRYSPAEKIAFPRYGQFAGQDALIRFGKYVDDYADWIGDVPAVANVTQDMPGRGEHVGYGFWQRATKDLSAYPAGPGSEKMTDGLGSMTESDMIYYLRRMRAYLYTGTVPASYTLGLIEAMLVGIPVVSIGPHAWAGPSDLFEAATIVGRSYDDSNEARESLRDLLHDIALAQVVSERQRARARDLFDVERIKTQWADFLGSQSVSDAQVRPAGVLAL